MGLSCYLAVKLPAECILISVKGRKLNRACVNFVTVIRREKNEGPDKNVARASCLMVRRST